MSNWTMIDKPVKSSGIEYDLKAKHSMLRNAYQTTERELDKTYSDELAEKFEAQFNELVAHENVMIAARIPC